MRPLIASLAIAAVTTTPGAAYNGKTNLSSQGGHDTLNTGTKTETVTSGAACVCGSETANAVRCSVSSTTLSVAGTNSDAFNWICNK